MTLSKKTLSKKEFGDVTLIQIATKLSRPTITIALQGGKITRKTHQIITDYYINLK